MKQYNNNNNNNNKTDQEWKDAEDSKAPTIMRSPEIERVSLLPIVVLGPVRSNTCTCTCTCTCTWYSSINIIIRLHYILTSTKESSNYREDTANGYHQTLQSQPYMPIKLCILINPLMKKCSCCRLMMRELDTPTMEFISWWMSEGCGNVSLWYMR